MDKSLSTTRPSAETVATATARSRTSDARGEKRSATPRLSRRGTIALICALLGHVIATPGAAQNAEFIPLGGSGACSGYVAEAVSDDGDVVAGTWYDGIAARPSVACLWTRPTGTFRLGPEGEEPSLRSASGLTADGLSVVGSAAFGMSLSDPTQPYLWSAESGAVFPGAPPGWINGEAVDISADGAFIAGTSADASTAVEHAEAFRWSEEQGAIALGDLPGGRSLSSAHAISSDGQVVVGQSSSTASEADSEGVGGNLYESFRWSEDEGMMSLGTLPGGAFHSSAEGVSADGSVIVGWASSSTESPWNGPYSAYRWTAESGMVSLGELPGGSFDSAAFDVSASGDVIVGERYSDNGYEAIIWTPKTGMTRLSEALIAGGATGLEGWRLESARAISANGRWVTGTAFNPEDLWESFLARLPDSLFADGFQITPALNDAWYHDAQAGQGFFLTVLPQSKLVFLGWFTYDTERPPADAIANLGDPGHRWLTAFGPYDGNRALLDIEKTSGGIFASDTPKPGQELDGTIELVFEGCNSATLSYEIPSIGRSGTIPITRVEPDNVAACEAETTR